MMNPLYIFYLVNRDVFDPEMEGTQYGYRLFATSGFVIRDAKYNTSPLVPCQNTQKLHSMRKRLLSAFSTQITNIYPAIPEVILIWLYQMVRQQWYSVIR